MVGLAGFVGSALSQPYNIIEFGAAGDGLILDTKLIQKAIDSCHNQGGWTVYFPVMIPETRSYADNYIDKSLIYAEKSVNVGITGLGTV